MHHLAKVKYWQRYRGFESPPLRHSSFVVQGLPSRVPTTRAPAAAARLALAAALLGACAGPSLAVAGDGPTYVDGHRVGAGPQPFRYYGTAVVDAEPSDDRTGVPDWTRTATRTDVAIAPPAPLWLFPFDLPIELLTLALGGRADQSVTVATRAADETVVEGFLPDLQPLRNRAFAARIDR